MNFKTKSMNRDNMYRYLVDHGSWQLVSKYNEVSFGYNQALVTNYHEPPSINRAKPPSIISIYN